MQTLYDSDSFVVLHLQTEAPKDEAFEAAQAKSGSLRTASSMPLPALVREGFEIVDKRSGKEIYLDGSMAETFHKQIIAWRENTPTQEEVEDTLESYTALAHTPVSLH